MSKVAHWVDERARLRAIQAIAELELKSAAEVVVTVRASSGDYRAADFLFASAMAFLALGVYVYFPVVFTDDLAPPAILLLFLASAFLCSQLWPLRRLLVRGDVRRRNVRRAALAEFVEQGIGRTAGRTGIFIYASLFEREVEVVTDLGVDVAALGESGARALVTIRGAIRGRGIDDLVSGMGELGDALAPVLPRAADDVNELPDALVS